MLEKFILMVAFSVFIRIARKKFVVYGGRTAKQILQVVDTLNAFLLFASIALFAVIFFIIFNKKRSVEYKKRE